MPQDRPGLTPEQIARSNALSPAEIVRQLGGDRCGVTEQNIAKGLTDRRIYELLPQIIDARGPNYMNAALDFNGNNQIDTNEMRAAVVVASRVARERGIRLDEVPVSAIAGHKQDGCTLAAQLGGLAPAPTTCPVSPSSARSTDMSSLLRGR